jgi:hypothetical protein
VNLLLAVLLVLAGLAPGAYRVVIIDGDRPLIVEVGQDVI